MIDYQLHRQVQRVAARLRRLQLWRTWAVVGALAAIVGGVLVALAACGVWFSPWSAVALGAACFFAASLSAIVIFRGSGDHSQVARRIEATYPALKDRLLTALEQQRDPRHAQFGFLQETVIQEALTHSRHHAWAAAVPRGQLRLAQAATIVSTCLLAAATTILSFFPSSFGAEPMAGAPVKRDVLSQHVYQVAVEPGDVDIERGSSLLVLARFQGALPPRVTLSYRLSDGEAHHRPMSKSLDDPLFGGRLAAVEGDLEYRVEFDGETSREFRVSVFEYPSLQQADAKLAFPTYTSMEAKRVEDVRSITAVEGTELTWLLRLNKPVVEAFLESDDGKAIELRADPDQKNAVLASLTLKQTRRYLLRLKDAQGRTNKQPPELVVHVTKNWPPELKLVFPAKDLRVSPLEELLLRASVWDDFGLNRCGLSYALGGGENEEIVIAKPGAHREPQSLEHLLCFENLAAQPDQLLSYYFWAEDIGPNGKPRRTFSDMYFAEVRHFEEIYRQGRQPPGGGKSPKVGGAGAKAADDLVKLQKQIVNATWKLIRRETAATPSEPFAGDVKLLADSQGAALEKLNELSKKLEDAQSKEHVGAVDKHMREALRQLKLAAEKATRTAPAAADTLTQAATSAPAAALAPALSAEQAAYQALLKLRAREHRVIRGKQQGGGGGGGGNRSDQQLQQLELTDKQNRYETHRSGGASPNPAICPASGTASMS